MTYGALRRALTGSGALPLGNLGMALLWRLRSLRRSLRVSRRISRRWRASALPRRSSHRRTAAPTRVVLSERLHRTLVARSTQGSWFLHDSLVWRFASRGGQTALEVRRHFTVPHLARRGTHLGGDFAWFGDSSVRQGLLGFALIVAGALICNQSPVVLQVAGTLACVAGAVLLLAAAG